VAEIGDRRLYLCTPDRPDLAAFVAACIEGGVDIVQLRDKVLEARQQIERAVIVQAVCADAGVPFVLNDRPDLALELGADGVHVGQDDAPPALARRILGTGVIVGYSTHAAAELDGSVDEPIDYVSTGPVEATPTKPGREGTGLGYLRYAAAAARHPFFVTRHPSAHARSWRSSFRGGARPDRVERPATECTRPTHHHRRGLGLIAYRAWRSSQPRSTATARGSCRRR
jgi:thiamine-phosphate pyrophosphorylase